MTILNKTASSVAAIALSLSMFTPVAVADRGDRGSFRNLVDRGVERERRSERRTERRERRSDRRGDRRSDRRETRTDRRSDSRDTRSDRRSDRRETRTDRRADRRDYRTDRRSDRRVERRDDRRADRRYANRVENRQIRRDSYRTGYRDARRHNYRSRSYSHGGYRYYQPRRVYHSRPRHYRPYYSRPSHSRIIYGRYHRPHYRYTPRYKIGGFYGYHSKTIIISDYWSYGLYDPPRGYHWVRDRNTGDAILASVATGAIIGLIIGALTY
ncbi:MAG: RcnB family protein [Pseudomonadota bacterium]